MKMIGICGGSWKDGNIGKTTVTNIIAKEFDFYPVSFTDPIKEIAKQFFHWDGIMDIEGRILLDGICRTGRKISEDYWRNLVVSKIPKTITKVVFDDVYFDNEVRLITGSSGFVIRVTKKGQDLISLPCETIDISNDGSLSEFQKIATLKIAKAIAENGF